MNAENAEYGKRIRNIREYQHLSREKLAEMSNISTQFLADIETGKKGMSVVTLHKICTALHTSADSIVFGCESSKFPELEAMFATVPHEKRIPLQDIVQRIITVI
ncbi:MAG: helix-turn-helix transcriptional regulator [Ruminococcaceae bacterium]|nr:helix-turn-helix transcriptional regulator [Oscillospiraceae bacterium]